MRRPLAALLVALLAAAASAGESALEARQREIADLAEKVSRSVVKVHAEAEWPWGGRRRSSVSGVVVDDRGTVATLGSAVLGAETVEVELPDGRIRSARVVGVDIRTNVGILVTDPEGLVPVDSAPPGSVRVGHFAMAVGNPFGLTNSVGIGVVSGMGREVEGRAIVSGKPQTVLFYDLVQTTAPINPGDSGGLLADARGRMIGMISSTFGRAPSLARIRSLIREWMRSVDLDRVEAFLSALRLPAEQLSAAKLLLSRLREMQSEPGAEEEPASFDHTPDASPFASFGAQSINFVLPADQVLFVARMLATHQRMIRLGVRVVTSDEGLFVESVVAGGPAAKAGIGESDVLLTLSGRELRNPVDLHRAFVSSPLDVPLEVVLSRRGERITLQISLE